MLLNPIYAPTAAFTRVTEGSYGDATLTPLGSCQVVVSMAQAASSARAEGAGTTQIGVVFTPRSVDRQEGDRFTYNGETYELMGHARGNQDHPFTGDDFGWISHAFRRVTL